MCRCVFDLWLTLIVVFCICFGGVARGQDEDYGPRVQQAVDRGLGFLARQQNTDGSFGKNPILRPELTGLTLLAFLSAGDTPDLGKFGAVARGATDYLAQRGMSDEPAPSAAVVALALAEVYGVETSEQGRMNVRAALVKIVPMLSLDGLKQSQPIWTQLAIPACAAIGILAKTPTTRFIRSTTNPSPGPGLFLNEYIDYCLARTGWSMGAIGKEQIWWRIGRQIMASEDKDGGWTGKDGGGRVYSTDLAVLILTIPYDLMPGTQAAPPDLGKTSAR